MEITFKIIGKTVTQTVTENGTERTYYRNFNNGLEAEVFIRKQICHSWQEETKKEDYDEFISWIYEEKFGK